MPATIGDIRQFIANILKRCDIGLALAVVTTLEVLILPMPSRLLDVCLEFSVTF
jgi:flagellar biosynthesis component FlhA